ncbi:HAD-IB family hydrolase [Streptomyces sp. SID5785]|nr:HAD-IB family hydrolase [Streptomyces sp. SID5785]
MRQAGGPVGAAFFDVDETLITGKSMLALLAFHWGRERGGPARFAAARASLGAQLRSRVPREQVNRSYYRLLRGIRAADLERSGRSWFAREEGRGLFHPVVVDALRRHRRDGDLVVLLSGSFAACLSPIGEAVGADLVVGTVPRVVDGVLTGDLAGPPMIGQVKADTARLVMGDRGLSPARCSAYGDDASDLSLLACVGNPVVVGDDPELVAQATAQGWSRLPGPVRPRAGGLRFEGVSPLSARVRAQGGQEGVPVVGGAGVADHPVCRVRSEEQGQRDPGQRVRPEVLGDASVVLCGANQLDEL